MSMGYLLPQPEPDPSNPSPDASNIPMDTTPISWRGLMVTKAMHQLLHSVSWGPLDVLFLDLPPGTGDVQLTVNQEIIVDGAVIVTTPQDIALRDAVRGFGLFNKMNIPVLGMVRNMAFFACPQCGHQTRIFSHGEHAHMMRESGVFSRSANGWALTSSATSRSMLGYVRMQIVVCPRWSLRRQMSAVQDARHSWMLQKRWRGVSG